MEQKKETKITGILKNVLCFRESLDTNRDALIGCFKGYYYDPHIQKPDPYISAMCEDFKDLFNSLYEKKISNRISRCTKMCLKYIDYPSMRHKRTAWKYIHMATDLKNILESVDGIISYDDAVELLDDAVELFDDLYKIHDTFK